MIGQNTRTHRSPAQLRSRALWLLVPLMFFVQVFGGRAALFHEHDDSGEHLHIVFSPSDESRLDVTDAWHHAQHESGEQQHLATNEPVDDYEGVLIQLPTVIVATGSAQVPGAAIAAHLKTICAAVLLNAVLLRPPLLPTDAGAQISPARRRHLGTADLLGSSRPLLI